MNAVFADKVVDTMLAEVDHQVHEGDPLRLAVLRLHLGAHPGGVEVQVVLFGPRNQRLRRPWSEDQTHSGGGPKNLIAEEAEGTEQLGGLYLLNRRDE